MPRPIFFAIFILVGLFGVAILAGCPSNTGGYQPRPDVAPRISRPAPTTTAPDDGDSANTANGSSDSRTSARNSEARDAWPTHADSEMIIWSSVAFPTGDPRTSAVGLEKGLPREARLNSTMSYDMVVTNLTANRLDNVLVSDRTSDNFTYMSSEPSGDDREGGILVWNLGTLQPREVKSITVTGTAATEGPLDGCSSVYYDLALCSSSAIVQPKLELVKTGPAEALQCEGITYLYEVSNAGTGTIRDVVINEPLPEGLTMSEGRKSVDFNVGSLTAGQTKQFAAKVMVDRSGAFESNATASGDGLSAESAPVATTVRRPVLQVTMACPQNALLGNPMEHSITVVNTGDGPARDAVIETAMPRGLRFVSAGEGGRVQGNTVTWSAGELEPNATKTMLLTLTPETPGIYAHSATARAYCATPVTAQCSSEVRGIPAILLEVVDIADPVRVGENETYVITVTNQGSAPDTNVKIAITLEGNQEYVSSSGAATGLAEGQSVNFAPLAMLGVKEKATFRVVVKNVKAGDVRFKVSMTSDQLTRSVDETEATTVYE